MVSGALYCIALEQIKKTSFCMIRNIKEDLFRSLKLETEISYIRRHNIGITKISTTTTLNPKRLQECSTKTLHGLFLNSNT